MLTPPNRSTNPIQPQPIGLIIAKILLGLFLSIIVVISCLMAGIYFYQQYAYNEQVKISHSQQMKQVEPDTIITPNITKEEIPVKEVMGQ